MPAPLQEYLLKIAIMIATLWIVVVIGWWLMREAGWLKANTGFNALDMRTWSLGFMLSDAAAFAFTFATASIWLDPAYCAAIAAVVAVSIVPVIASRLPTRARPER
jgi:hypothetical protein